MCGDMFRLSTTDIIGGALVQGKSKRERESYYEIIIIIITEELVTLNSYICIFVIQVPPVNRAIWQRRFSIFSVSGEGG